MQQPDRHTCAALIQRSAQFGVCLGGVAQIQHFAFFDQGTHPVHLPPLRDLAADPVYYLVAARFLHNLGHDGRAPGRQLVDG